MKYLLAFFYIFTAINVESQNIAWVNSFSHAE